MVDRADHLLACWNGASGGTRNCIQYALQSWGGLEIGLPHNDRITVIDPTKVGERLDHEMFPPRPNS